VNLGPCNMFDGVTKKRSGVRRLTSRQDFHQVLGNLSQVLLRALAYAALLVACEWIGIRPGLGS
jgi:hypothetical protein